MVDRLSVPPAAKDALVQVVSLIAEVGKLKPALHQRDDGTIEVIRYTPLYLPHLQLN